jgi:hypothetical protein
MIFLNLYVAVNVLAPFIAMIVYFESFIAGPDRRNALKALRDGRGL